MTTRTVENAAALASVLIEQAANRDASAPPLRVAISGIDGSGKTTIARQIEAALSAAGVSTALIHLDPWHNPQSVRFAPAGSSAEVCGRHFYENAFRWNELFGRVIEPLMQTGSVDAEFEALRLTDDVMFPSRLRFKDVRVVLVEGVFLLSRERRGWFDHSVWIECSFETALTRAMARNQEGLPQDQIIRDYQNIYFPAQRWHIERDDPKAAANIVLKTD